MDKKTRNILLIMGSILVILFLGSQGMFSSVPSPSSWYTNFKFFPITPVVSDGDVDIFVEILPSKSVMENNRGKQYATVAIYVNDQFYKTHTQIISPRRPNQIIYNISNDVLLDGENKIKFKLKTSGFITGDCDNTITKSCTQPDGTVWNYRKKYQCKYNVYFWETVVGCGAMRCDATKSYSGKLYCRLQHEGEDVDYIDDMAYQFSVEDYFTVWKSYDLVPVKQDCSDLGCPQGYSCSENGACIKEIIIKTDCLENGCSEGYECVILDEEPVCVTKTKNYTGMSWLDSIILWLTSLFN